MKKAFDIETRWVHFPLHPDTPPEGQTLEALFRGRNVDVGAMNARMKRLMEAEGLPYGRRTHTYNSRLAQELGCWADTEPGGEGIHDILYKAYFVEGRNIGEIDTLVGLAASAGLSGAVARRVLEEGRFRNAVDRDWGKASDYGITGVPTFVALGQKLVGAQPYEALAAFLNQLGVGPSAKSEQTE